MILLVTVVRRVGVFSKPYLYYVVAPVTSGEAHLLGVINYGKAFCDCERSSGTLPKFLRL